MCMWPGKVFVLRTTMERRLKATKRLESRSSQEIDGNFPHPAGPQPNQNPSKHGDGRAKCVLGMKEESQKEIRRTKNFQSFRLFPTNSEWRHFMRNKNGWRKLLNFGLTREAGATKCNPSAWWKRHVGHFPVTESLFLVSTSPWWDLVQKKN